LGEIPLLLAIRETGDAGAPITASDPESAAAAAFRAIAASVVTALDGSKIAAPSISIE
jgi:ATP-binding protein involved in chromosome partitioning